jgi:plastocyanin
MKLKLMIAGALAAATAFATAPSQASVIVAGPGAATPGVGYPVPVAVTQAGTEVTFVNLDPLAQHDVVSVAKKSNGQPKFKSALVNAGETSAVVGTATLTVGDYDYFCSLHPTMTGTLTVA